jgi:hypothetical protein
MWVFWRGDTCKASTATVAASTSTPPAVVAIEPGHDAWVVGDQAAVLIEVD